MCGRDRQTAIDRDSERATDRLAETVQTDTKSELDFLNIIVFRST